MWGIVCLNYTLEVESPCWSAASRMNRLKTKEKEEERYGQGSLIDSIYVLHHASVSTLLSVYIWEGVCL